jgi:CubicO group peptidase (beta-lactamase class C family)
MVNSWTARASIVLFGVLLLATSCSDGGTASLFDQTNIANKEYPGVTWTKGDPVALGFDSAKLNQIAVQSSPETECLLVTRHGKVAGEWYFGGHKADQASVVMSVTQSFVGTLVGLAQDEGLLNINDKVSTYIPSWKGTPSENVTIRDILSHDSGRESTNSIGNKALHTRLITSPNPAVMAEGLTQQHPPGEVWSQNLPAIELLNPILTAATGQDPADFAQAKLFRPIGALHTKLSKNNQGYTWMHSFLETTCDDAARLGYLYLRQGNWNGKQVLSKKWVDAATHPSQKLNKGWGYMWWLNRPGSLVSINNVLTPDYQEPSNEKLVPNAPDDMYWAVGFGGRYIQVDPASDTVVVRLGGGDEAANMQQVTRVVTEAMTKTK